MTFYRGADRPDPEEYERTYVPSRGLAPWERTPDLPPWDRPKSMITDTTGDRPGTGDFSSSRPPFSSGNLSGKESSENPV